MPFWNRLKNLFLTQASELPDPFPPFELRSFELPLTTSILEIHNAFTGAGYEIVEQSVESDHFFVVGHRLHKRVQILSDDPVGVPNTSDPFPCEDWVEIRIDGQRRSYPQPRWDVHLRGSSVDFFRVNQNGTETRLRRLIHLALEELILAFYWKGREVTPNGSNPDVTDDDTQKTA